jgi:hypothetical protein
MASAQAHPRQLLTTRTRAAIGAVATAYVLALTIRELLHLAHADSGWLTTSDGFLPSWLLIVANTVIYAGLCWAAFSFLRDARGRERIFLAAWSAGILLSPLEAFGPYWSLTIHCISALGMAVALFIAVSLMLERSSVTDSK